MDRNEMIQAVQDLRTYYERAIVGRTIVGKRIAVPRADGSEGYALAYGPEGNEPLPTVINIHGGGYILYRPESQSGSFRSVIVWLRSTGTPFPSTTRMRRCAGCSTMRTSSA